MSDNNSLTPRKSFSLGLLVVIAIIFISVSGRLFENIDADERTSDPATNTGLPTMFKIRDILSAVSPYRMCKSLIPITVPDKAYLLHFDYIELPLTLQTDSTGIPLYPNDQTMKKFCEMQAVKWQNGAKDPDYQALRDELSAMVTADRIKDGQGEGNSSEIKRDPIIFL